MSPTLSTNYSDVFLLMHMYMIVLISGRMLNILFYFGGLFWGVGFIPGILKTIKEECEEVSLIATFDCIYP